jgi:hypothetical protein
MAKPSFDIIPTLSIHPNQINIYNEILWSPYRPKKPRFDHLQVSDKKTHGKVSVHARRKVSKAIDYLLYMANDQYLPDSAHGKAYKFKIAFITLTLPSKQIHSDKVIKDYCLNQFIIELKTRYHVNNYIWRAEKQINGNVHFHILVNAFIPWSELRDRWNRIINKLGYVDRYRNEMRKFHSNGFKVREELLKQWDYKKQVKAYRSGKINDWNSPNSTDIHSLYKVHKIKEYVTKYCTKDEAFHEVSGRLWSCNYELTSVKGGVCIIDSSIKSELNELIATHKPKVYDGDHFTVIHISIQQLQSTKDKLLYNIFSQFIFDHFKHNIQTSFIT